MSYRVPNARNIGTAVLVLAAAAVTAIGGPSAQPAAPAAEDSGATELARPATAEDRQVHRVVTGGIDGLVVETTVIEPGEGATLALADFPAGGTGGLLATAAPRFQRGGCWNGSGETYVFNRLGQTTFYTYQSTQVCFNKSGAYSAKVADTVFTSYGRLAQYKDGYSTKATTTSTAGIGVAQFNSRHEISLGGVALGSSSSWCIRIAIPWDYNLLTSRTTGCKL